MLMPSVGHGNARIVAILVHHPAHSLVSALTVGVP